MRTESEIKIDIKKLEEELRNVQNSKMENETEDQRFINNMISESAIASKIDIYAHSLIAGEIQQGKTGSVISVSFKALKEGHNTAVCINNFKIDLKQIEGRFQNHCLTNNLPIDFYKKFVVLIDKKDVLESIMLFSTTPKIYIFIGNKTKIDTFNKLFGKHQPGATLYVIVDESDLFTQNLSKIELNELNQRSTSLLKTFKRAIGTCKITATPHAHFLMKEETELISKNVHIIEQSNNYIGYNHNNLIKIKNDNFFIGPNDEGWSDITLNNFLNLLINYRTHFEKNNDIPITIVNVSNETKSHTYIEKQIRKAFPDATTMIVNSGIIRTKYPDNHKFTNDDIIRLNKLKKQSVQDNMGNIQKDIQENIYKHKMVVIIACKQAGRGISFRSEVPNFNDISQIIYANSIIYSTSDPKCIDDISQGLKRVCGIFPNMGDKKIFIASNREIFDNIDKQTFLNEKMIEAIKNNPNKKVVEIMPYFKDNEIPTRKQYANSKGESKIYKLDNKNYLTEESYDIALESKMDDVDTTPFINKCKKWKKDNGSTTIISRFALSLNANTTYTKNEILQLYENAGYQQPSSALNSNTNPDSDGYNGGYFIKKIKNKYQIEPSYKNIWIEIFG